MNEQSLQRWLAGYESAWEKRDAAAAARLFAADATYYETPYSEPFRGRDGISSYWSKVTADQRDVDFESQIIAVAGSVGVARWSARFINAPSGAEIELNGVFVLDFDGDGLCRELREWWVLRPQAQ